MKIALVEGEFNRLSLSDIQWLQNVRCHYGRLHVALWPGANIERRKAALDRISSIWTVHVGRSCDVLPYIRETHPDAEVRLVGASTTVFKAAK